MSSTQVRASFRGALQAAFPAVEYVETVGSRVNNLTLSSLWQTMEFIPNADDPVSIGDPCCWRETGVARVWVGAATGSGDVALTTQADAVLGVFRRYRDAAIQLRVMSATPVTTSGESDGRWLLGYIDLSYQRDFTA